MKTVFSRRHNNLNHQLIEQRGIKCLRINRVLWQKAQQSPALPPASGLRTPQLCTSDTHPAAPAWRLPPRDWSAGSPSHKPYRSAALQEDNIIMFNNFTNYVKLQLHPAAKFNMATCHVLHVFNHLLQVLVQLQRVTAARRKLDWRWLCHLITNG